MVPTIESDRVGRPWVEFWGDGLYRIDVPERAFALPLGDMSNVYHVHRFDLVGISSVPLCSVDGAPRHRPHLATPSPYSRYLTYWLFKDPTTFVGMIGGFIGGAVDLTWSIEDSVQAG